MSKKFDVLCVGNAIVDVLHQVEEPFIEQHELAKGSMTLINGTRADFLYHLMDEPITQSGGSAGNTAAGLAGLGMSAAYNGKVYDDALGRAFARDIRNNGVTFTTPMAIEGARTARCLIFVTPDGERTMNTYLGACTELSPEDIDPTEVANASVTYLEGYLWDPPLAKEAFRKAIQVAHEAGNKTSITLSDSFCVDRYRNEFRNLLNGDIDILFANEDEAKSLFQTDDLSEAVQALNGLCEVAVVTRGAEGSMAITSEGITEVNACPVDRVLDTTGAGDLFASGYLAGYCQGKSQAEALAMGSEIAAKVIAQVGARLS